MLTPYQIAWLNAHLERSSEWLKERLKDGFDVHHLDGNHENNDPMNLVLIECGDHMMLHNGAKRFSRVVGMNRGGGRPRKPVGEKVRKKRRTWIDDMVEQYERELANAVD